jgi:hypothetical protein
MNDQIKSALDAAGTAADYSARATYQRGYDAGVLDAKNTISVCGERDAAIARADAAETERDVYTDRIAEVADDVLGVQPVASSSIALLGAIEARHHQVRVALAQAEAREWALGVQVVAQQERLRLADALADAARTLDDTAETRQVWDALAAWATVPGMEP